jgi:hypothetical protein
MGSTLFAPRCLGSGTILYGSFTSLQYASMNTLVYADISEQDACSASSIASPMQQMLISFGAATAGLGIQKALSVRDVDYRFDHCLSQFEKSRRR